MKKPDEPIESIFKSVFYDEALSDYNYNGFCNSRRTKKRAMKSYAIFTNCLLEAWTQYGVTAAQIRSMLGKIVRNLHGRKRFRRYRDRVREQKISESRKRGKPSPALLFPLTESKAVIKLEESVRTDPNTRRKYIKFLRRIKSPRNSVVDTFCKICTDDAIFRHFSWASQKASHPHMQRESLQKFLIFTDCMLEAWSSHGITKEDITMSMASIVKRIYVRNNVRNFRAKSSHKQFMGHPY
ncbi:uncharacterized protein LOC135697274 [Ochlerotatus camptorhynchus]|uniref:uncharacterized protein LOC135697274 n=1 Tax=Ochlerotatus camptorhynchus TaxID=644619 RepID=UPI0031D740C5